MEEDKTSIAHSHSQENLPSLAAVVNTVYQRALVSYQSQSQNMSPSDHEEAASVGSKEKEAEPARTTTDITDDETGIPPTSGDSVDTAELARRVNETLRFTSDRVTGDTVSQSETNAGRQLDNAALENMYDQEDEEEEEEMVVLAPGHALLEPMQRALEMDLLKDITKLELDIKEKTKQLKSLHTDRENLGVNLYGVQQQLAKQQMLLESKHDYHAGVKEQRIFAEDLKTQIEQLYQATISDFQLHLEKDSKLRGDVEALDGTLYYLGKIEKDLSDDIFLTKRAAHKALEDISKAENKKYVQDLYVDRLVEQVDKITSEIAMYDAQFQAQHQETESMKALLSEASCELEAVTLEKKKLIQQWQTSLIGMQRRDEAKAAMHTAVELQREHILSLETELTGYKKSIMKEQQRNEQLTMVFNKLQMDMITVKRHIQNSIQKREQIKAEYSKYARILQESEVSLQKTTTERNIKMNEMNNIRVQIEKEAMENQNIQQKMFAVHQKSLSMDKSAEYSEKNAQKMTRQAQELEAEVATIENDLSIKMLEISKCESSIKGLDRQIRSLDKEIRDKNELIAHSQSEIIRKNAVIERKQGQIDQFNKKIDQLQSKEGGEEMGPLELQITTLTRQIKDTEQKKQQLEQYWLKEQAHLVQISSQAAKQWGDVNKMKRQHTILSQKKIRLDSELEGVSKEIRDIKGLVKGLQNDMTKLNTFISKKSGERDEKEQSTVLLENEFVETLRDAEKYSISLQNQINEMAEEKERLLGGLVDAERQIMLWEKKIQLAKETRNTVDTEYGKGELKAMKCEIHRMEVRHKQLLRQQELLVQETVKAVGRRSAITARGEAQAKSGKAGNTKGLVKKRVEELRKKVKSLSQEAVNCDKEIHSLREHQVSLAQTLEEKNNECKELQNQADLTNSKCDVILTEKDKVTQDLLSKQKKKK